jgi:cob(I)alamin adenosyltransferase
VSSAVQAYLNRLSDFLFVAARYLNHTTGTGDIVWSGSQAR